MTIHKPVLLREVLEYLSPHPDEHFIDATLGGGGHARAILDLTVPEGRLLGIDQDHNAIAEFTEAVHDTEYAKRVTLVQSNFEHLQQIVQKHFPYTVSGILLDIGFSSDQLERSGRGFTFSRDEPLDMRMDKSQALTASDIVNGWPLEDIERILRIYGEEAQARRISQAIIRERKRRKIQTTESLRSIIYSVNSHARRAMQGPSTQKKAPGKIDPATKTFQALRIAVNSELEVLEKVLPQAFEILAPQGRLVVISFHGLEDRIVKQFIKQHQTKVTVLTKKPVMAQSDELRENPRARSARLRAIKKT